jgi:hypothetical protein
MCWLRTIFIALSVRTVSSTRPAGSVVDVWVLAGQSNCVGTNFEDGQSMPAAAAPMPGEILCFDSSGRSVLLGVGGVR